jgi:hypothetical protein
MFRIIIGRCLLAAMLLGSISFSAYAWSPFGPKNFDDCVLDGMKGVKSDLAAQLVYRACREKFPDQSPKEPPKRSGTPRMDIWDAGVGHTLVGKVETGAWKGQRLTVTNRNRFELTGIFVAIPKDKGVCVANEKQYKEIYFCRGSVGANLTGTVDCSAVPPNVNFCVTGIAGPSYVGDLDKWFRDNGY